MTDNFAALSKQANLISQNDISEFANNTDSH